MAVGLLSLLCTFESSTKSNEISFDPDSLFRIAKRSIPQREFSILSLFSE